MAALWTSGGAEGDLHYKCAESSAPGSWEAAMLWNISGLFSTWLHAYKQHSICALSALASNSIQQEWFSTLKQLVLRFLHLYSVGYSIFHWGGIWSGPWAQCPLHLCGLKMSEGQRVGSDPYIPLWAVLHLLSTSAWASNLVSSEGNQTHAHQNCSAKRAKVQEVQMITRYTSKMQSCLQLIMLIIF